MTNTTASALFLLSLNAHGAVKLGEQPSAVLMAATLHDLIVAGRVRLEKNTVHVVDTAPTSSDAANQVLAAIAASRPRSIKHWVRTFTSSVIALVGADATKLGLVTDHSRSVLAVFPVRRFTPTSPDDVDQRRATLVSAALALSTPSQDDAVLLALIHASGVTKQLLPGVSAGQLKRRIKELESDPVLGDAVRSVIFNAQMWYWASVAVVMQAVYN